jgi:putative acetyltransferase
MPNQYSTMHYTIHKPVAADFPRLLSVWEASVRATHDFVPEDKVAHLKNLIEEQQLFSKSDMFCIHNANGEVAGFAGVTGDSLDMLFIHPDMIGTGAGKALISYAIKVKKVKRVDVNEQNEHAASFYRHFGFEVTGRSEVDDNGEPFPLLHMELK